jgi:hypothetical protein
VEIDGLKESDTIDGGSFSASAGPYQSDPEGEPAESPEQAAIDYGLDVADPSSGCDDPVDDRRHTIDRPARIKHGMLHRPGQGAVWHGTDGEPKDDTCQDVDPPL